MHQSKLASLEKLLETARALKKSGQEQQSVAMGPEILRAYFAVENGYELPRKTPKTFTEKLYCRMLDVHENGAPLFSRLSDKVQVRNYVAEKVGEQHLIKVLWQGADTTQIPWHVLPAQAILKCTEGSGKNILIQNSHDLHHIVSLCQGWQAESYYWFRREYHYYDVPRNLLIEEVLSDGHPDGPLDYIFFCFDGIPRLIQVGSRSHSIHRFFTPGWEPVQLAYRKDYLAPPLARPKQLEAMLEMAARLSSGFDFVRIDLYCLEKEIKFGEMTFTPRAGHMPFQPQTWNDVLGEYWTYHATQAPSV